MTSDDEAARVHGYLAGQGEKYSFVELWPRVVAPRLELLEALREVSEQQADFKPADDAWSIREVAHHVLNSSRGTARVVEELAHGRAVDAASERTDPAHEPAKLSLDALRSGLAAQAAEFGGVVAALPQRPPSEPTYRHFMFGDLHARAWYLFQRVHDQDHVGQVAQIKQAPGYPAA